MSEQPPAPGWFATALDRGIVIRSLKVSLIVGTLLALINHGDRLLAWELDMAAAARIVLTYIVPYAVATWSAVQTRLNAEVPGE